MLNPRGSVAIPTLIVVPRDLLMVRCGRAGHNRQYYSRRPDRRARRSSSGRASNSDGRFLLEQYWGGIRSCRVIRLLARNPPVRTSSGRAPVTLELVVLAHDRNLVGVPRRLSAVKRDTAGTRRAPRPACGLSVPLLARDAALLFTSRCSAGSPFIYSARSTTDHGTEPVHHAGVSISVFTMAIVMRMVARNDAEVSADPSAPPGRRASTATVITKPHPEP